MKRYGKSMQKRRKAYPKSFARQWTNTSSGGERMKQNEVKSRALIYVGAIIAFGAIIGLFILIGGAVD